MKTGSRRILPSIKVKIERSSGNVFADLGLPNAEDRLAKAELTQQICDIIQSRKLTQSAAAVLLGVDQPKISALMRGKLEGFSTDRLIRFLHVLGRDIEIVVRPSSRASGKTTVRIPRPARAS